MAEVRENRLLLGNPGTGKSTLVNCLVGQHVFNSGVSWGGGLTQEYQKHVVGDVAYMDTPGLADASIMEKAAEAINTALKQGGTYKLFFMVRLQAGRVVADDLVTVERVLDAISLPNIPFSILVNNLPKRQYEAMTRFGPEYDKVAALINRGKHQTPFIFFIPKFPQLDEVDNAIMKLPDPVIEFLETRAPSVTIPQASVSHVNTDDFAENAKELKTELERLREDHAELERMMRRLQDRFREDIEREREYHRRNMDYHRQYYESPPPAYPVGDRRQSDYRMRPPQPAQADYERQSFYYAQQDPPTRSCPCNCVVM
jgi:GTP-binding protein EngB required for normal cell division